MTSPDKNPISSQSAYRPLRPMPALIFASRWLQLPLYLGLIVAQAVYVVLFIQELLHLVPILWDPNALSNSAATLGVVKASKEIVVMLVVLSLIDVVMISNLLIMVIIGGYETFVSRLHLESHPDQPDWLDHIDAGVLKVKLGVALISISSIHLLRSFIDAGNIPEHTLKWEVIIHMVLVFSAGFIAATDWLIQVKARQLGHSQPSGTTSSH